ncbi:MAG: hypothetical protein LCI03_08360 [Actinobacteria bacterium]|jgi:hypothetical protein|nr:hypothetical protein [Actinomycetota bacterium]
MGVTERTGTTQFQRSAAGPRATRLDEAREGAMWVSIALGATAAVLLCLGLISAGRPERGVGAATLLWMGLSFGAAAFAAGAAGASIVLSAMRDIARQDGR